MIKPIALVPRDSVLLNEIQLEAIELLEEALHEARDGNITGMCLILKRPNGEWSDRRTGITGFPEAIGMLEIIQQTWIKAFLQCSCSEDGNIAG